MSENVFIAQRYDDRKRGPGYEEVWCMWCGIKTYAHPTSTAYTERICGDCGDVIRKEYNNCTKHGNYPRGVLT